MTVQRLAGRVLGFVVPLLIPLAVFAQGGLTPVLPPEGTAQGGLVQAIRTIVNIILILAGIVAVIYLIIGGVQYITSQGDEDKAATAKNTVLFAVIGLIVIGLSAAVVNFFIGAVGQA
jgi:heme/copper-type cytochrome/quinol oxidase subunit 2